MMKQKKKKKHVQTLCYTLGTTCTMLNVQIKCKSNQIGLGIHVDIHMKMCNSKSISVKGSGLPLHFAKCGF